MVRQKPAKLLSRGSNPGVAFCGKIYKNANGYYATEILSKGIEELLSNPIEFYKKDREYFKFVISVLKGDI